MSNNYTPYMKIVPLDEWEALQKELAQLRAQMQTTVDPEVGYKADDFFKEGTAEKWQEATKFWYLKAAVDSGKTIENNEGTKVWLSKLGDNPIYCYCFIDESMPGGVPKWEDIEYLIKQTKGWRIK